MMGRTDRRTLMLALVCAIMTIVAPVAAGAHTTQGSATPGNDGPHPWPTDRCSTPGFNVNAVNGVFDFGHACVHHDGCYTGFPQDGGPTYWTDRQQCDAWFLYDMQASCRWLHGNPHATWQGRQCMQWADNYHWGVRTYGSGAYQGPGELNN